LTNGSKVFSIDKIKSLFSHSEFTRNVLTLMSGTTFAHAIPFIISPIVSRLYTPEDFGVLGIYTAIVLLFSPVVAGTYDQAIILAKEDSDGANITALSVLIAFVISVLVIPIVLFFSDHIGVLLNTPDVSAWLVFIPLSLFLVSSYNIFSGWFTRLKKFNHVANSQFIQTAGIGTVNLGLGYLQFGSAGLVIGRITGQSLSVIMLVHALWKERRKTGSISLHRMMAEARRHQDFPRYTMPRVFLDGLSRSSMFFIIPALFAPGVLGSYTWMAKIIGAPLSLIGLAVGKVFYQRAADAFNSGEDIWPILKRVLLMLSAIAVIVVFVMVAFGPSIFSFAFGEKWREAGIYARILSPWFLTNFIVIPVSQTMLVFDKQKKFFLAMAGYNLVTIVIFTATGVLSSDAELSFTVLSLTATTLLIGIILWLISITRRIRTSPRAGE